MAAQLTAALAIFARAPILGTVKTRVAAQLGNEVALALHRNFLSDILSWATKSAVFEQIYLYLSTPWPEPELPTPIQQGLVQLALQTGGDLGQRMHSTFQELLGQGYEKVVIIGSDSPHLPSSLLSQALESLAHGDLVIGPAEDGGYYLIGANQGSRERLTPLFQNINWGTGTVLEETLRRVEQHNLSLELLPPWEDIDNLADLQKFKLRLTQYPEWINHCPQTVRLIEQLITKGIL